MIRWHHSLINYILDFCDEKASLVKAFALEGRIIPCRKYNIFNTENISHIVSENIDIQSDNTNLVCKNIIYPKKVETLYIKALKRFKPPTFALSNLQECRIIDNVYCGLHINLKYFRNANQLKILDIDCKLSGLSNIRYCPNLEQFIAPKCSIKSNILSNLSNLKKIDIKQFSNKKIILNQINELYLVNILKIELYCNDLITFKAQGCIDCSIFRETPNLKEIDCFSLFNFENHKELDHLEVLTISLDPCQFSNIPDNVRTLNIYGFKETPDELSSIIKPNIEIMSIGYFPYEYRSLNWDKITPNLQKIIHGTY